MNESSGIATVINMLGNTITMLERRVADLEAENTRLIEAVADRRRDDVEEDE